jgi:membrane-associated phospholipid phosphatase
MNLPRDFDTLSTVGWVRVARLFSNIISPPVIFATLGLALSLKELPSIEGLLWAAIFGFWVSLAPIIFVVYLLRTGRISDLHMNTRRERRWPYIVSFFGALIALAIIIILKGPGLLFCLAITSVIALGLLALITNFWMISIHATSMAAAVLISGLVFGLLVALLLVPLLILVVWVRLYLRRHTVAQVFAGMALGLTSVVIVALNGCYS